MNIHHIRLVMSGLFLMMSVLLFARHWLFPPEMFAHYKPHFLDLGAAFALLLSFWNLSRWYAATSWRRAPAQPVKPRTSSRDPNKPEEYLPEFDFDKK